jgi:hypothetical protein
MAAFKAVPPPLIADPVVEVSPPIAPVAAAPGAPVEAASADPRAALEGTVATAPVDGELADGPAALEQAVATIASGIERNSTARACARL